MKEKKREEELKARILRDTPNPVSIGNGVHRDEDLIAQKKAAQEKLEYLKKSTSLEEGKDAAMKAGKFERDKN